MVSEAEKEFDKHINEIRSLTLSAGEWDAPIHEITNTIIVEDNEIVKIHMGQRTVLNAASSVFFDWIRRYRFGSWNRYYDNRDVLDGDQWELTVKYNPGRKDVVFGGSNAYPSEFEFVRKVFEDDFYAKTGKQILSDDEISYFRNIRSQQMGIKMVRTFDDEIRLCYELDKNGFPEKIHSLLTHCYPNAETTKKFLGWPIPYLNNARYLEMMETPMTVLEKKRADLISSALFVQDA
jgi:hypothetical protein